MVHLVRRTIPGLSFFNAPTHLISLPTPPTPSPLKTPAFSVLKGPAAPKTMAGRAQGAQAARPTISPKPKRKPDRLPPVPPCFRGRSLTLPGVFLLQLRALLHACCHVLSLIKMSTKSKRSQFLKGVFILKSMTRKPLFAIMKSHVSDTTEAWFFLLQPGVTLRH